MKINSLTTRCIMAVLITATVACNSNQNSAGGSDSDTTALQAGTGDTSTAGSGQAAYAEISATKQDTTGRGTANFVQKDDGTVEMTLQVTFPAKANSSVAAHFHEHGDCGNSGAEAHGHWNPTNEAHGKWGDAAYHSGDIGNIPLDANGKGEITLSSNRWSIGGDEKTNILNRAIIIHSGVDDYKSQPSGNSGSRIGCGVIMPK